VEEVVELRGLDPCDGVFTAQQLFLDHRDRGLHSCRCRPLCRPGLKEIQPALFDRELDVLNVAVVALESLDRVFELVERGGERLSHLLERDGAPDTGDHVLTLRVQEELAADPAVARRGVAAEADTGSAITASVPEHHLHHVDRCPEVFGNLVGLPVHPSAWRVPGVEDGAHGAHQLLVRVGGERVPRLLLVDLLVALGRAEFGGQILLAADALAWNPGIEEIRAEAHLDRDLGLEGDGLLQQTFADIAPGADDVGDDIDGQWSFVGHGCILDEAAD
jgi:hypothetical protein